jgi:GNAT superfamily N-acetyltransferase
MKFEVISPLEATRSCRELIEENFAESGMRGTKLKLQEEFYRSLAGTASFCIVAKVGAEPVGLVCVLILRHMHTDEWIATNDTLFVSKPWRPTGVGGRLFIRAERLAYERGATTFQWQTDEDSPLDAALARREHFEKQVTYFRKLRHG